MDALRQTKKDYWELYQQVAPALRSLDGTGDGVTGPGPFEEPPASPACNRQLTLAGE